MSTLQRIRRFAKERPDAPAIQFDGGGLSYGELYMSVEGLATSLGRRGVGSGERVAILLERGPDLIVAILAVMASGAAYVPIDTEYPTERIGHILRESEASVVLARHTLVQSFGLESSGLDIVDPETWGQHRGGEGREPAPDDLAYIIFTSGSSGTPKGVAVTHGALENYLSWCDTALPRTGGGAPLFASIAFDHAVTCVFPPLRWGEPLRVLPKLSAGGANLADELLDGTSFSFVKITPSHLRVLTPDQRAALGRSCQLLMLGGERADPELVNDVRRDAPLLAVMNHYGPTEATVGCCVYQVPAGSSAGAIPIGSPISGMETRIVGADGEQCVPGEIGELHVSGAGLARGYWKRPELTKAAFVELPSLDGGEKRWYRTGDLVRENDEGFLEYVGRADRQVKILGHRVELAEIEAVLQRHPQVLEAAVVGVAGAVGVHLCAAVVLRKPLAESGLRTYLESVLPLVAVPRTLLFVDRLPVTAHGKVDLQAIASLVPAAGSERDLLGVRDEALVRKLCDLWRALLNVPSVAPDDDFFELGGDSVASMMLLESLWERCGVQLQVATLFDAPTPRGLACAICEAGHV